MSADFRSPAYRTMSVPARLLYREVLDVLEEFGPWGLGRGGSATVARHLGQNPRVVRRAFREIIDSGLLVLNQSAGDSQTLSKCPESSPRIEAKSAESRSPLPDSPISVLSEKDSLDRTETVHEVDPVVLVEWGAFKGKRVRRSQVPPWCIAWYVTQLSARLDDPRFGEANRAELAAWRAVDRRRKGCWAVNDIRHTAPLQLVEPFEPDPDPIPEPAQAPAPHPPPPPVDDVTWRRDVDVRRSMSNWGPLPAERRIEARP